MKGIGVEIHFTTPGHPGSDGAIEKLHNTLREHLHILQTDRQITGREALARAALAYNNTSHTTRGQTPLEAVMRWRRDGHVADGDILVRLTEEKLNNTTEKEKYDTMKLGDIVYVRNWYKRKKTDTRYKGPQEIVEKLERCRVKLRNKGLQSETNREVHANEVEYKKKKSGGSQIHISFIIILSSNY